MTFTEALEHLTNQIERYRLTDPQDGNTLSEVLQQITSTLYLLEKDRAQAHKEYQEIISVLIREGLAVNKAENQANVQVPEMYLLRKVMDSGYKVSDAIRTQLSWIKSGLTNA